MSELVSYRNGDESALRRSLARILESMRVVDGQVSCQGSTTLEFARAAIAHRLKIRGVEDLDDRRAIATTALFQLPIQPSSDLTTFIGLVELEVRRRASLAFRQFYILIPLRVPQTVMAGRRSIRLLGQQLRFLKWTHVMRKLPYERWKREARPSRTWPDDLLTSYTPVFVTVPARDSHTAFRAAHASFECLRILLNLSIEFGRVTWRSGARPEPLSTIFPMPVAAVFDDDQQFHSLYFTPQRFEPGSFWKQPVISFESIGALLPEFRTEPARGSIGSVLHEAVIGYGRALDAASPSDAFLAFWQVLERITFPHDERYSTDEVCKRAGVLLTGMPDCADALPAFADIRNKLVHAGDFHGRGDEDVRMMKLVTEECIQRLVWLKPQISTLADLDVYYRQSLLARGNRQNLSTHVRISRLIQRELAVNGTST